MFMLKLIRLVKGYVTFIITGAFPNRFISLCMKENIPMWDIIPKGDAIVASTYAKSYKHIRPIAKKSGTKTKIIKKHGAWLVTKRYKKRLGLILGFVLMGAIYLASTQFIWRIDIQGSSTIEEMILRQQLYSTGVKVGKLAKSIDARETARKMMLLNDNIAWIAINIIGSTAEIQLRERVITPEIFDENQTLCNIIAECDGQIVYLEIYEGEALVSKNETVSKGDIIVSGIMEDQHGQYQFKHARAKIIANVYDINTIKIPLQQEKLTVNGESFTQKYLQFFSFKLPLFIENKQENIVYSKKEIDKENSYSKNINIIKEVVTPYKSEIITITEQQAKELAMEQLKTLQKADSQQKVFSREVKGELTEKFYILTETVFTQRDIAVEQEIFR